MSKNKIQRRSNRCYIQKDIYECKYCGKRFRIKAAFKKHQREHKMFEVIR